MDESLAGVGELGPRVVPIKFPSVILHDVYKMKSNTQADSS